MRKKWEGFLSELIPSIMYIMSVTVQELIPYSRPKISSQQIDFGLNIQDRQIEKIENNLFKKTILPILEKDYKKDKPLSDKKIIEFMKSCLSLTEILQRKYGIEHLAQLDLKVYQNGIDKIKNITWITPESQQQSIQIAGILMDYTTNIINIVTTRMPSLEKASKEIDVEDLFRSLYGSLLAFVCLMVLIDVPEFQNQKRFKNITTHGYELAKNLDGYTDTLDILTSPDELALFRKTESL